MSVELTKSVQMHRVHGHVSGDLLLHNLLAPLVRDVIAFVLVPNLVVKLEKKIPVDALSITIQ